MPEKSSKLAAGLIESVFGIVCKQVIRFLFRKPFTKGGGSAMYIPFCASPLQPCSVPSVHLLELLIVIVIGGLLISRTLTVRRGPCESKEEKLFAMLETHLLQLHTGKDHMPVSFPREPRCPPE